MNDKELEALVDAATKLLQAPPTEVWCGPLFVGGNPHENWVEETRWRTEAICRN